MHAPNNSCKGPLKCYKTQWWRYTDKAQISITKMHAPILLVLPWGEVSNFKKKVLRNTCMTPNHPRITVIVVTRIDALILNLI